jgi:hypothetical protein
LASSDPNAVALYVFLHQRVKSVTGRVGHWDAERLRNGLLDLHEAEHVSNFRRRVIIDEEVEIAVGPLVAASARAENNAVAPISRRAES